MASDEETPGPRFQPASDQSLLVYFGERISLDAHRQVLRLLRLLEQRPIGGVINVHPAYCSLLVVFDALRMEHHELEAVLRRYILEAADAPIPEPREVEVPVCYGGEFGPDLEEVAAWHGLTPAQAIECHSAATYTVYFLGFVPGFAYLGEVSPELVTPRLPAPRRRVPAGSVGIAGSQTGVYPVATPGGWRLLGRTPSRMFRLDRTPMSLLAIGDQVRFTPISRDRFAQLERA